MEMKYVVPDMAQSFGTLEFAGESEPVFERDKNNRRVLARRSYNLYSDVQKGENVVVEIPVQAGEKKFKYEQKVKLVNPKLYGRGYAIGDMAVSYTHLDVYKRQILMDVMMPVMDGIAATKAIRAMDRADAKTVPIIAMTANAFEEDAKRCLAAGMTAHLAKPFQIEDVEKAIVECCGK